MWKEKKGNHVLPLPLCCPWVLYKNRFVQIWVGPARAARAFQDTFYGSNSKFGSGAQAREEDSINSAGLLAFTGFLLMPACKSND